jgi:hypothetical protein
MTVMAVALGSTLLAGTGLSAVAATTNGAGDVGLRLLAAQPHQEVTRGRQQPVYLWNLGLFVAADRAPFELRVSRAGYRVPVQVWQVLHTAAGDKLRALPANILNGWQGIKGFLHVTVTDGAGKIHLNQMVPFCPDSYGPQRINDQGPSNPTYPLGCSYNPFTIGTVFGIDHGWAVNPLELAPPTFKGADGDYTVTAAIAPRYATMFGVPAQDASVTVGITVKTDNCCGPKGPRAVVDPNGPGADVPTVTNPSPSTLPDLIPLPSWGIQIQHLKRRNLDYLTFGATVWVGGNAQMTVEGFRRPGTNVMDAFQYFYKDGQVVGRAPAGTMLYDARKGHQHWHFEQFAQYRLLNADQSSAVLSSKEAFCLAPTDSIDLSLKGATYNPGQLGFFGACGDASSIWTRETLPLGWGDTYFQGLPGQSFNISTLPNGVYYIEVTANPLGKLHETNTSNNVRLRKVILSGTLGNRTVRVPPWRGIDSEANVCPPNCPGPTA